MKFVYIVVVFCVGVALQRCGDGVTTGKINKIRKKYDSGRDKEDIQQCKDADDDLGVLKRQVVASSGVERRQASNSGMIYCLDSNKYSDSDVDKLNEAWKAMCDARFKCYTENEQCEINNTQKVLDHSKFVRVELPTPLRQDQDDDHHDDHQDPTSSSSSDDDDAADRGMVATREVIKAYKNASSVGECSAADKELGKVIGDVARHGQPNASEQEKREVEADLHRARKSCFEAYNVPVPGPADILANLGSHVSDEDRKNIRQEFAGDM